MKQFKSKKENIISRRIKSERFMALVVVIDTISRNSRFPFPQEKKGAKLEVKGYNFARKIKHQDKQPLKSKRPV